MKNLLKKLHIMSNQVEESGEGSTSSSKGSKPNDGSSPEPRPQQSSDHKPFLGLSNWINSVAHRHSSHGSSPPSSIQGERVEPSDAASTSGLDVVNNDIANRDSGGSTNSRDPDIEEEYQIQLALELSAREDPEAVQIEAVKQISLGSCAPENTPAEVVAYRYWNYNALSYDDKILDGFYDLHGIWADSSAENMPSLVDLQGTPLSDRIGWEAILVDRAADTNLLKLEQTALVMAAKLRSESLAFTGGELVGKLAILVSDYMGGPVTNPDNMLRAWRSLSFSLKAALGSMVLPLGSLTIGLAHHRALLFKVLADSLGIPCRLVKGRQYTGSDDVAMNFVKIDDGREYIVDLMADPGTLIPSDAVHIDYEDSFFSASLDSSRVASSSSGVTCSFEDHSDSGMLEKKSGSRNPGDRVDSAASTSSTQPSKIEEEPGLPSDEYTNVEKPMVPEFSRPSYPYMHARSPSWTEGVSSPAARRMKVKDVSKYMIDAAKENPQLAQKLHDVLLESGVVAPPNLFTEIYSEEFDNKGENGKRNKFRDHGPPQFLPPLPPHQKHVKSVEDSEVGPIKYVKNVPMAAAAAAAAAVVASSMVVAAAKSSNDSNLGIPVAAAATATATAAVVVATTAAVSKQYEQMEAGALSPGFNHMDFTTRVADGDAEGDRDNNALGANPEGERVSDRSAGNESTKSDVTLDDVSDCEIPWEEITVGERIGLGSYGEVYRGEWHGTEVAVKKFLDQDISGESLEEFKSEVRIMKRVRHPNVVLFMGAVTRAPNLSIITEFLPRGSLYRLLHRPNNQLDERRRLRMALDAARGMNYLHNCTPVIVHRDLKSPNLLVDKNWVVKVCDFGLSRMKHSTFLSSRSTAGTAEWMAPEVLRNEPSDEKCDVFSYGVILWELCTMQQPWGGMNPMQVVGAVGFQHRRLDIPDDMDPAVADIISQCWQTNPKLRPSFSEIMAALKPLQKPITSSQVSRQRNSTTSAQQLRITEDSAE